MTSEARLLPILLSWASVDLGGSPPAVLSDEPANCMTGISLIKSSLSKTESAFCCDSVPSPAFSAAPAEGAKEAYICKQP